MRNEKLELKKIINDITGLNEDAIEEARLRVNSLAKPLGSLGKLEDIAIKLAGITGKIKNSINKKCIIIMSSDNGVVEEGVASAPQSVTLAQTINFSRGVTGVAVLAKENNCDLKVVDIGVNTDIKIPGAIDRKIRKGTYNIVKRQAMSYDECIRAINIGIEMARSAYEDGYNILGVGEMGIGNTSSSSMWMTCFTGIPLEQCVGAGSGLDNAGIRHKYEVLKQSLDHYKGDGSPRDIIRYFGGLEMVMAVGAMLQAAELGIIILVDGFIMTNCILAAAKLYPEVMNYAIFGHCGDETGHKLLLDNMEVKPLLNLGLRLGEGTGAICAYPIVESAILMINEMDNFAHASITKYF